MNSWIYTIYSVVWPCMCHHRWDAVGAWLATADETLTFEPLVCDICEEWQMNRKRKEIFFFKRFNSPFLSGCGSWFGRLEPRPGRFPLSGDERRWSRWRKWHRISESCCRASFAVLLAHRKKKKRKLLDGILQKSSTRDGEGEVWDGVTPVSEQQLGFKLLS